MVLKLSDAQPKEEREAGRSKQAKKKAKKAEKARKKADEVDAAFKESSAMPDADTRKVNQSRTLEAMFEAFFRVLKQSAASPLLAESRTGEYSMYPIIALPTQNPSSNLTCLSVLTFLLPLFRIIRCSCKNTTFLMYAKEATL